MDDDTPVEQGHPPAPTPPNHTALRPWRPVAGLAERPSRMAFSDRLFPRFVYAAGLAMAAVGVGVCWACPFMAVKRLVGVPLIIAGVAVFAFGGPSGSDEKGYRL